MDAAGFTNTIFLLLNSLTIVLALVMLLQILWQDARSATNLAFALFAFMGMLWSSGALLSRALAFVGGLPELTTLGIRLMEVGFTGACAGLYLFTLALTGGAGRRFNWIALTMVTVLITSQAILAFSSTTPPYTIRPNGTLLYTFTPATTLFYLSFAAVAMLLGWERRTKIKSRWQTYGIYAYGIGIMLELISPELRARAISLNLCAVALLIISYSLLRAQIIEPLAGRAAQLQAVRDVGLAITSRVRLEEVLSTVAGQAAGILGANGAAIFLNTEDGLTLAAVHNMPDGFLGGRLALGEGLAGEVALNRQSTRIEDYHRDWVGVPDMPYAEESFGGVIAAPLIFAGDVMGVLMVIEGVMGKRFDKDDVRLLDLLSPQAAVAITNSRLFERQRGLAEELETAKNQLEAVLVSTQNPVMALDHTMQIIFANPAADALFEDGRASGKPFLAVAPFDPLLQVIHDSRSETPFELVVNGKTYLCTLGRLRRLMGYVAVLNDITDLKELDRQKTQMIQLTSHNLKNPLFAAMSCFELLQEDGEALFTPDMRKDMNQLGEALTRMDKIIHTILNLERLQIGGIGYEETPVETLLEDAADAYLAQAERGGVALTIALAPDLPLIHCNRHYLTQALTNLIENALKFTRRGGRITVGAQSVAEGVVITVADTGVGIPTEALSRVFERFYRARQAGAEDVSGSGLGLSLVKAVIDAHAGRIWVESEPGMGTTFSVALPVKQTVGVREG
ncbi:MAG TPA: ATP-binding protein [Aggregatilineales bacterium]|nr:GAF domain-containing protein [Anaerolineales bacterium]HRE47155.1 ATP-binding protein [Aggregatilineales bacterium]